MEQAASSSIALANQVAHTHHESRVLSRKQIQMWGN